MTVIVGDHVLLLWVTFLVTVDNCVQPWVSLGDFERSWVTVVDGELSLVILESMSNCE